MKKSLQTTMIASFIGVYCMILACSGPPRPAAQIGRTQVAAPTHRGTNAAPQVCRDQKNAMAGMEALDYLPAASMLLAVVNNPLQLASLWESTAILNEYGDIYKKFSSSLKSHSGATLLEAETWLRFGVDSSAPIGVGVTHIPGERPLSYIFFSLLDQSLFAQNLEEIAADFHSGKVEVIAKETNTTVYLSPSFSVIVRGKVAIVSFRELAGLTPYLPSLLGEEGVISDDPLFVEKLSNIEFGDDLSVYISAEKLLASISRNRGYLGYYSERMDSIEKKIEEAQLQQKPQKNIDLLEQELQEIIEEEQSYERLRQARQRLKQAFRDMGMIFFGFSFQEKNTDVCMQLDQKPGTLATRLLSWKQGPFRLLEELQGVPIVAMGAHLSPAMFKDLVQLGVEVSGNDLPSLDEKLEKEFGLSLDSILALLEGEMSFAFVLNSSLLDQSSSIEDALNLQITFKLKNPKKTQEILRRVVKRPNLSKLSVDGVLRVPYTKTAFLRIEVEGEHLLVHRGLPKAQPELTPAEKEMLARSDLMMSGTMHPTLLGILFRTRTHFPVHSSVMMISGKRSKQDLARKEILDKKIRVVQRELMQLTLARIWEQKNNNRIVIAGNRQQNKFTFWGRIHHEEKGFARSMQKILEALIPTLEYERTKKETKIMKLIKKRQKLLEGRWKH